jgi:hypothetical protein
MNRKQHISESRAKQASNEVHSDPHKIGASTPYDFSAKNLTPYGGLLPVTTMLEKIGFQQMVEENMTVDRNTKVMSTYQFILAIVMGIYLGFTRLNQLRYIAGDPLVAGILKVVHLPPQCTLWRFLNSLHSGISRQVQSIQRQMREAVWAAGNIVLRFVTIDTDTTVHTLYGKQMGARKSYNPKNRGKKSYQPILSFIAETKEFIGGELRNGDRPTEKQIARHLKRGISSAASLCRKNLCTRRFRILLLGSGGSLRKIQIQFHRSGAQDISTAGRIVCGPMGAIASNRCRRTVRVLVSAAGLGQSVSVHCLTFRA